MQKTRLRKEGMASTPVGNEGMTLVETMVAAFVLAVGVLGLMSAFCSSMVLERTTQDNNRAVDVARQVMEIVKSEPFTFLADKIDITQPVVDGGTTPTGDQVTEEPTTGEVYGITWSGYEYYPTSDNWSSTNVKIYDDGSFDVGEYRNGVFHKTVAPWPSLGAGAKVGQIRVRRLVDAAGNDLGWDDVLEVTVAIRWCGRSQTEEAVLRCQVGDWE